MRPVAIVVSVLCAALVGLLAYGLTATGADRSLDSALARGERPPAPVAALPRVSAEGTGSIADHRGKVVVLNFWASWCPPCVEELPLLQRTHAAISGRGGLVLGVTNKDARADARGFVDRFDLTFDSLRDRDGSYGERFGLTGLPETFVLDREGRVRAHRIGPVDRAWLDRVVEPLL